jgi:hypothetical protein
MIMQDIRSRTSRIMHIRMLIMFALHTSKAASRIKIKTDAANATESVIILIILWPLLKF